MLKWLGRIVMAIALVFLALDAWDASGKEQFVLMELGLRWFQLHADSYQLLEPAITRHVSVALWDYFVLPIMLTPAFLVFFIVWLALSLLSWLFGRFRAHREEW